MAVIAALVLVPAVAGAATIRPDTTGDGQADGNCTLREAVEAANTNTAVDECKKGQGGERDVIQLKPREYKLTFEASLGVTSGGPLTVRGKRTDDSDTEINTEEEVRIFTVLTDGNLTLEHLELSDGNPFGLINNTYGGNLKADSPGARLTLRDVDVDRGRADVGGGIYIGANAKLAVKRSDFTFNEAADSGGAISTGDSARVKIRGTRFFGNITDSTFDTVYGGAIDHRAEGGSMTIADSTLFGNKATTAGAGNIPVGGAIFSEAPLAIDGSLFLANSVTSETPGVIERGGALSVYEDEAAIVNSTFVFNDAGDSDGFGGAVFAFGGAVSLQHVTLADNLASDGGDSLATLAGTIELGRSIVDDATIGSPCDGSGITSLGFNVSEDDHPDCNFVSSDLVNSSALGLISVGDHGGPTDTVAISKASDARNFVPKAGCMTVTGGVDQRGYERPAGKRCDAGAFERGAKKP